MITGSPNAEKLNTPIRGRRGDRAKRRLTHYNPYSDIRTERGCPSMTVFRVERFLTGMVERDVENAYGGTEKRLVLTVIDAVAEPKGKANGRTGPRRHRQPQTLNAGHVWTVPRSATRIVEKREKRTKKDKAGRKGFTVTIGDDGCRNVSVRSHLFVHGYTSKNKHSVDAPDINGGMFDSGAKVVDNNAFELANITLESQGKTKLFTAVCACWNPAAKVHKRIVVPNVRNKKEAIVVLRTAHKINV